MGMPRTGRLARWQLFCVFACAVLAAGAFFAPQKAAAQESPIEFLLKQRKLERGNRQAGYFPSNNGRKTVRSRLYFGFLPGVEEVPRPRQRQTVSIIRPNEPARRARNSDKQKSRIVDVAEPESESSGSSGSISYCVRLCDGFFFPIGDAGGNTTAHEAACQAQCPTAETRLFTAPAGSDGIDDATSKGQRYSRLPTAFRYRDSYDKACTCNAKGQGVTSLAFMQDFTMRPGDVVMTGDGLKVLAGAKRFPFKDANFVPATWSKKLSAKERDGLKRLEDGGRTQEGRAVAKKDLQSVEALFGASEIEQVTSDSETLVNDPQQLIRYLGTQEDETTAGETGDLKPENLDEQASVEELPATAPSVQ